MFLITTISECEKKLSGSGGTKPRIGFTNSSMCCCNQLILASLKLHQFPLTVRTFSPRHNNLIVSYGFGLSCCDCCFFFSVVCTFKNYHKLFSSKRRSHDALWPPWI